MADQAKTTTTDEPDEVRPPSNGFDRYFQVSERGSTLNREVRGGLATFFTMAYIVILNPLIIGTVPDVDGQFLGTTEVAAVTALVAGVMTVIMGVVGRYPFAIATGPRCHGRTRWVWWCSRGSSSSSSSSPGCGERCSEQYLGS